MSISDDVENILKDVQYVKEKQDEYYEDQKKYLITLISFTILSFIVLVILAVMSY